jgi:opacity protein-like surface antigen
MGRITALLLATGVVAVTAAGPAMAADLLPPPPPIEVPPPPVEMGGWYLRGDVGVGINELDEFRSTIQPRNLGGNPPVDNFVTNFSEIGDSALIRGGVGYQFNSWLRADITGEYRTSASFHSGVSYFGPSCAVNFCMDDYHSSVSTALFMANGYVDLGTWFGVTPYVGAGIGGAFHKFGVLTDVGFGTGYATSKSTDNFAWAVMAGLGYNITPNLKLEAGYRYIDMGKVGSNPIFCGQLASCFLETQSFHLASHDLHIGFRYYLNGDAPRMPPAFVAPPGPLVRKY